MKKFHSFNIAILSLFAALLLAGCCSGAKLRAVAPAEGSEQSIHYPIQLKFIAMPREERRAYFADEQCRKELKSEGFWPKPVTLAWETACDKCPGPYTVTLSYDKDFADGTCYVYTTNDKQIEVTNLRIATKYYWKVQYKKCVSDVSTFVTDSIAPRLLRIPEGWNCRDLGGRIGLDGRRVKQDMVIRTGGLNKNATPVQWTQQDIDNNPKLKAFSENVAKQSKFLYEVTPKELPYLLNGEWTVFLPKAEGFSDKDLEDANALTAIPEEFMGAKGKKMSVNEKYALDFSNKDFKDSMPSLMMMEFESSEEGIMPFRCGADWYWHICFNGNVIYDRRGGNGRNTNIDNYMLYLPVQKGRNLITIPLGSGSGGFSWYIAPVPEGTKLEDVVAKGQKENKSIVANHLGAVRVDETGKPMYIAGKCVLNDEGKDYLLNVLKLKSEIDLRGDTECALMTGSPLGDSVTWFHYSSSAYAGIQSKSGRKAFTQVFKVFLDEKNYPIDFHCIAGQDRTGAVAFIINALLGVEEEELYLDWECTGFWNSHIGFRHEELFDKLVESFQKYPGDTIHEKVENYVLSLGFTQDNIQHLRDIMLEK